MKKLLLIGLTCLLASCGSLLSSLSAPIGATSTNLADGRGEVQVTVGPDYLKNVAFSVNSDSKLTLLSIPPEISCSYANTQTTLYCRLGGRAAFSTLKVTYLGKVKGGTLGYVGDDGKVITQDITVINKT